MSRVTNNKNKKVTIKHIAKAAGLSFSTVAKALRKDPVVKTDTREKILKIAKELNYYPNAMAKGLRSRKSKTIGIILNDLTNPLYYETIEEIEKKLKELDYTMILSDSKFDMEVERHNLINMLSKNVDGLIFSPVSTESENIEFILDNKINTVFIDAHPNINNINYVYVDHQKASYKATKYLINKGHKNILILNGPSHLSSSKAFLNGYKKALSENKINLNDSLLHWINISIENGCKKLMKIYKDEFKKLKFSAVLCLSDLIAVGVYKSTKELKIRIPGDLSVIGYDDIFISEFLNPPLTTIHAPKRRVGIKAVNIILNQIKNDKNSFTKITLDPEILERESVKSLK